MSILYTIFCIYIFYTVINIVILYCTIETKEEIDKYQTFGKKMIWINTTFCFSLVLIFPDWGNLKLDFK